MDCSDPNVELDDLADSEPFPITDLILREACMKVLDGDLLRKVLLLDSELSQFRPLFSGRHVLWLIYQDVKVSEATGALFSFRDLNNIAMKGDDIRRFLSQWDYLLLNLPKGSRPPDSVLLDLLYTQINKQPVMKQYTTQVWDMMDEADLDKTYESLRDR